MKMQFLLPVILAVMLGACSKKDSDITIPDTPRSEIPEELVDQWLNGTFSMSEWWSYDGTQYEGNPYERSTAFNFSKDGRAEFYLAINTYNDWFRTEGLTYQKGTVKFNEANHSFTFYPQQGNYRSLYSCSPESNFDRSATADELKPATYYYTITIDEFGKEWMVVTFGPDDPIEYGSYFKRTSW